MERGKLFLFSRFFVRLYIGRWTVDAAPPAEPTVYVCSHSNLLGPLATLCWLPVPARPWTFHMFLDRENCRTQYRDYTFSKRFGMPRPLAAAAAWGASGYVSALMRSMGAIPVHRGTARIGATFRESVAALQAGDSVLLRAHGVGRETYRLLERRGARIVDATCPKVAHVQRLVEQAEREGRQPVMIGDPEHPEVRGAAGWCESLLVFSGPEEVGKWAETAGADRVAGLTVVSQTTLRREVWETSLKIIKKECTNVKIFDTICDATHTRQSEAAQIAARVDAMVVVGDPKSANTTHLTEICGRYCSRVFQIENADELPLDELSGCARVGLTAGASTPASIIKEVKKTMSEEKIQGESMENFAELVEQYTNTLNTGDKVTGVVTAITPTEIHVDLGCKQAGYIPVDQLSDDPSVKPEDVVKVGDEVELFVIRVNDVEGYATLSKKRVDAVKVWENIETACENKDVMEGVVTEENKGGVVVSVKGVRVFVPASQSGLPRDAAMTELVKQRVKLRVTEVNRARRRVVGSRLCSRRLVPPPPPRSGPASRWASVTPALSRA